MEAIVSSVEVDTNIDTDIKTNIDTNVDTEIDTDIDMETVAEDKDKTIPIPLLSLIQK